MVSSLPNTIDASTALLDPDSQRISARTAIGEESVLSSFQLGSASTTANLLSRNAFTGATQIWSLNGSNAATRQDLPTESDENWQVSGIADFNRDGQQDLLWHNFKTGGVRIWQLNNGTVAQSIALHTVNDFDWKVQGLADFNNDGSTDVLWRNLQTGGTSIWFLNGTSIVSKPLIASTGSGGWRVQGIADLNVDRSPDLIWYNINTAETVVWVMNNGVLGQGLSLGSAPSLDWKVAGMGDFNGDRNPDLFWRNDRTGETQFWLYNGTTRSQIKSGTSIDSSWQALSATDLNKDGTTDLLWRNPSTGELLGWFVQNGSVSNTASVLTEPDLDWQPIALYERSASLLNTPTQLISRTGTITGSDSFATAEIQTPIFSQRDRVDAGNLSDFYRFTIGQSGIFTAGLTALTGDADVRLIQDTNGNGAIDNGEILAWQWERGTTNESIRRWIAPGTYFVQVLNYNNQTADYTVSTGFTAAASDDQQFKIELNFADSLAGLSAAAQDAINQAARFWEGVILNRSAITRSNILPIALTGENLVSQDGIADTGTLALSGPSLTLDTADNIVITRGSSTLNIRKFAEFNANPIYLRDIMIHEFAHVFGFGTAWEPLQFSFSDGSTLLAGKNWINRTSVTYRADSYAGTAYGDLLGTFKPTAIPIEPQIFYHWDETRFDTELMTPFAETPGVVMPMSSLTLGALRDLGWNVNFGAVQPYTLPTVRTATLSEGSTDADPTSEIQRSTSTLAAYKCACGRCLSSVRTQLISPTLVDAIAA
ncbi:MAG: VCBS repeat-containing protein [Plectolyngbya sp. WJT66-NPBG17]|jgi:hypothetical protein|nr:VCBS repeat-containing protein [Plectolyngbya sp. WJT66-NPBG17]